jgi:hypothetical protein
MPWLWRWNPDIICYTGIEYKEVLRKKYNLPDDWEPTPYAPPPPPGDHDEPHACLPDTDPLVARAR